MTLVETKPEGERLGIGPSTIILPDQQNKETSKRAVITPPHLSKQWAEVELLLRKPILSSADIRRTLTLAEEGKPPLPHLCLQFPVF